MLRMKNVGSRNSSLFSEKCIKNGKYSKRIPNQLSHRAGAHYVTLVGENESLHRVVFLAISAFSYDSVLTSLFFYDAFKE